MVWFSFLLSSVYFPLFFTCLPGWIVSGHLVLTHHVGHFNVSIMKGLREVVGFDPRTEGIAVTTNEVINHDQHVGKRDGHLVLDWFSIQLR